MSLNDKNRVLEYGIAKVLTIRNPKRNHAICKELPVSFDFRPGALL